MKRELKVALVCSRSEPGETAANLANHAAWTERAAAEGAGFVGFPECSLTGYVQAPDVALRLDGPEVAQFVGLAHRHKVFLSAGLVERRAGRFYNTQIMAGPRGMLGVMRKINLTRAEQRFFTGGGEFPIFSVGPAAMGIAICADATHYATPHVLSLRGAEVVFSPHATYLKNTPASWKRWRRERWPLYARDCGAWLIGCNHAGCGERPVTGQQNLRFASGAMIVDPRGNVVAATRSRRNREEMLVASIPLDGIGTLRGTLPAFTGFRKDVFYRGLMPRPDGSM